MKKYITSQQRTSSMVHSGITCAQGRPFLPYTSSLPQLQPRGSLRLTRRGRERERRTLRGESKKSADWTPSRMNNIRWEFLPTPSLHVFQLKMRPKNEGKLYWNETIFVTKWLTWFYLSESGQCTRFLLVVKKWSTEQVWRDSGEKEAGYFNLEGIKSSSFNVPDIVVL